MSNLIGGARPQNILVADDERTLAARWQMDVGWPWPEPVICDYTTPYWPGRSYLTGGYDAVLCPFQSPQSVWFEESDLTRGANSRFGVAGITRDVYGSLLAGCTVKLFRTSTDEKVSEGVSDPTGYYFLSTPYYPDAHYVVAYKAGSPDLEGATVNTLIGS